MPTGIYKKTKEHIKKIVKSRKRNNKEWHTKETRIKLSLANKGRKLTKEHREKISKNHAKYWLGKHFTEETKKKNEICSKKTIWR